MKYRYIAIGNTYPHRKTFTDWAWHWDADRGAWVEDNGSEPDELCIKVIKALPNVRVIQEVMEPSSFMDTEL